MKWRSLQLRPAMLSDGDLLLRWRNDAVTRQNFIHGERVSLREHEQWLRKTLSDPHTLLYIAYESRFQGRIEIGTIRLTMADDEAMVRAFGYRHSYGATADISLTIDPGVRGLGYGKRIVNAAVKQLRSFGDVPISRFLAGVKPCNIASLRVFCACGFLPLEMEGPLLMLEKRR